MPSVTSTRPTTRYLQLLFVLSGLMSGASAQQRTDNDIERRGDPQRWYQEKNTSEAYLATLKKEANAVYQETIIECKKADMTEVKQCRKEAKNRRDQDLRDAKMAADKPM